MERLYGVMHGAATEFAGVKLLDHLVAPSKDLMKDILTLPPGTKVGVETSPELRSSIEIQGETIGFTESNKFYWDRILRLCQRRGLEVVYLEDIETYKRYLKKVMELKPLNTALGNAFRTGGVPERVMQQIHKVQTEAEYIFLFEREEKIFDRIQETQPTIAILGRGHTDPLLINSEPLNRRGITVEEHKAEEVFFPSWHWNVPERAYERASIAWRLEPDEGVLLERDLLKRKYRAVMEGRVMDGKTPDYIGTWDTQVPARGLFEVYLNGDGATGTIEDCLGTATFVGFFGDITGDLSFFVKKYILNESNHEIARGDVIYEGYISDDGEVFGEFRSPQASGSFKLNKFNGAPYPVAF